jgi:protein involved in polysaccharide export with SLBB domain
MRISDLIRASGKMTESAYTLGAELTRYEIIDGEQRKVEHMPINLSEVLKGEKQYDMPLRPHDSLTIKSVPAWDQIQAVELRGEVRFPGKYPVTRGEKLSELVKRAGGLTQWAYPEGALYRRESLAKREQAELDKMAASLEAEIAAASIQEDNAADTKEAIDVGKTIVGQARSTRAVGRLVIELAAIVKGDKEKDVIMQDGDQLFVPGMTQEVTVLGEVFSPTSHIFDKDLDRDEYINMSGGLTHKADKGKIYVVRANGAVLAGSSGIFGMGNGGIKPGDTIVVPLDAEKIKPLKLWTNVTQILYQLGIAAASWKTVGVL